MFSASVLASLALTLLPAVQAQAYIPYAWNTSAPAIHDQAITASYGIFDISDRTTGFCPDWDPDCPSKNTTILSGPGDDGSMWMGSLRGGQQIYTFSGGLAYTQPDSVSVYLHEFHTNFTVEADAEVGADVLRLNGDDWYICEYYSVPLKVFAAVSGEPADATGPCYKAVIRLEETNAPAVDLYG
ncbi:hypothetical protein AAFC00_000010 [Neodothiora populina]|uniref:Uncharacterized protein n=1 Tax=Neodothiora populina TaxID=2781224 RepID=A0ABR3P1B0_9PEZI